MRKILVLVTVVISIFYTCSAEAQLLYRIEKAGQPPVSYIFGTHHLAPVAMLDSIRGLSAALEETSAVVGEVDMTGNQTALALQMQPFMTAPADSTLSKIYSPKTMSDLNDKFKALDLMPGVDLYALQNMKPMVIANLVTLALFSKSIPGYNPGEQLDKFFQERAASIDEPVIALETPAQQAELVFGYMPISIQAKSLKELIEDPQETIKNVEELNEAYFKRDLVKLEEMSLKDDESADFMRLLVDNRNISWVRQLKEIFATTPAFVAVGALHLPGENGLLNLLRREGYIVTAVD